MRQGFFAFIMVTLLVVGLVVGYIGGVANRQIVTTTVTATTVTSTTIDLCSALFAKNPEEAKVDFTVEISFQGQWNATVTTYSAFKVAPDYLHTTCDYYGSGPATIYVVPWNPNGEQTVMVTANKFVSGYGNLTVSVGWGEAFRSNSTILPYGSATTFISIAP